MFVCGYIFRVSADVDEVTVLKSRLDLWELPQDASTDAHAPASLLKLWYRELYEPLIPDALYNECVNFHDQPEKAIAIVQRLPELNRLVLSYLIRFLQVSLKKDLSKTFPHLLPTLYFIYLILFHRSLPDQRWFKLLRWMPVI